MLIIKRTYKKNLQKEIPYWSLYLRIHRLTFLRECFRVMRQRNYSRKLFRLKTAAKDIGMKAIDVGKTVAIDAGKKLVEKAAKKLFTPKSQVANVMVPPEEITKK